MERVKKRRLRRGIAAVAAIAVSGFLLFKTCSKPKPEGPIKLAPVAAKAAKKSRSKTDLERRKRVMKERALLRLKLSKIFKIDYNYKTENEPSFDFGKVDLDMTDACARLPKTKRDVQKFLYDKDDKYPAGMYRDEHQLIDPYLLHAVRTAIRQFGRDSYEGKDPDGNDNLIPMTAEELMRAVESSRVLMEEQRKFDKLFWLESQSERDFQAYLVAHDLFPILQRNSHDPDAKVPDIQVNSFATKSGFCSSGLMTCMFEDFSYMARVTDAYCSSDEGQQDTGRCKDGKPRKEPPEACYGYTDFVSYVRDCAMHYFPEHIKADFGADVMAIYYRLRNECLDD